MFKGILLAGLLAFVSPQAVASEAQPVVEDVALEKRVMEVSQELRCLVCQNQTIAESHAELAVDLKNQVRDMLKQGKSQQEVVDYMVQRYGDFVLYRPQMKAGNWLLWFGPFVLLALAAGMLYLKLRQRQKALAQQEAAGISAEEHARAASLLSGSDKGARS